MTFRESDLQTTSSIQQAVQLSQLEHTERSHLYTRSRRPGNSAGALGGRLQLGTKSNLPGRQLNFGTIQHGLAGMELQVSACRVALYRCVRRGNFNVGAAYADDRTQRFKRHLTAKMSAVEAVRPESAAARRTTTVTGDEAPSEAQPILHSLLLVAACANTQLFQITDCWNRALAAVPVRPISRAAGPVV